ncbi:DUF222 domain-containing protein [Mycobacterium sp.]|uniref:HNH endonuclease signature motif containing protein n=1 Tax=Mycobacterium sp. TaxID=1785 RepID=UPI003C73FFDD
MFEEVPDAAVVLAIGDSAREENIACARRLAAVFELYERRQIPDDGTGRGLWRVDPWEAVAAEIAAAQGITAAAAGAQLHNAVCLHQRLPKVAALFATGALTYQTVRMVVTRTLLALEPDVLADIDTDLAEKLTTWGPLSLHRTEQAIDALVERHDPAARRQTETAARSRYIDVNHRGRGTADINGLLYSTDATVLDQRLTALAHTVCNNDPRTVDQRRADALGALAAGQTVLGCACGMSDCPAADTPSTTAVVVHVLAEQTALDTANTDDLNGERPGDSGPEIVSDPERLAELIREAAEPRPIPQPRIMPVENPNSPVVLGGPVVPAAILAELAARGAVELRPLLHPGQSPPEPRYRPSAALSDFIRCRDMTCRFPNCDQPAYACDIDHTTPYDAGGPTHASNLKCLCRKHHLLKTFWAGITGWRDKQLPDGTVIWTSPSDHTYRTAPGSRLLVPQLCLPTAELPCVRPRSRDCTNRGVMMPKRAQTRSTDRLRRIIAERKANQR